MFKCDINDTRHNNLKSINKIQLRFIPELQKTINVCSLLVLTK